MPSDFPNSVKIFPTLVDLADSVLAAHHNERGDEITAVETYLFALLLGWIPSGATWSYVSVDGPTAVISIDADVTGQISVKDRIWLQQTTDKYFLVSAVGAYSGGATEITVYGGTDYTLANAAINNPHYSHINSPVGFPAAPSKWDFIVSDTTTYTKTSPVSNTRYGQTNTMDSSQTLPSITVPIGIWDLSYFAQVRTECPTAQKYAQARASLSTSQSAENLTAFTRINSLNADGTVDGSIVNNTPLSALNLVELASKTTYYVLLSTANTAATNIQLLGATSTTVLRARCLLL